MKGTNNMNKLGENKQRYKGWGVGRKGRYNGWGGIRKGRYKGWVGGRKGRWVLCRLKFQVWNYHIGYWC